MKTVYKYVLPIDDEVRIEMPAFAEVLSVGVQGENVCVWALVDPTIPKLHKTFRIAGTGHPITESEKWKFIGTVFLYGGGLVFHAFELDPKRELPN
jgi:hypothetical protein